MNSTLFRTMALDLGDKQIGIAVSDLTGIIANGLNTLVRTNLQKDLAYLVNLIKEREVGLIVIGLPINMDGTSGIRVEKTYAFANELKQHTVVPIEFYDERLTSAVAEKVLISADVSRSKRKQVVDKLAATIILQDYLNAHKRS